MRFKGIPFPGNSELIRGGSRIMVIAGRTSDLEFNVRSNLPVGAEKPLGRVGQ
jgi:hypothetical protein